VIDVSDTVAAKWEALNCHRTQFGPGNLFRRLPEADVKQLMSLEHFAQAWPIPLPSACLSDLFSGLS
jgi:LmbE family N-acetylglucosaminyl deacetylase